MTYDPERLGGVLFESVADDEAFAALPFEIARLAGTVSANIQLQGPSGVQPLASHGINADSLADYNSYYWDKDVWASSYISSGLGVTASSDEYMPAADFLKSEIYNDFLRGNGDLFRCLTFITDLGDGERLLFGAYRARSQRAFEPELLRSVEVLLPQLRHVVKARRREAQGRGRLAVRLLDDALDGVVLVGRDGGVRFANASATRLLDGRSGPLHMALGRLTSIDTSTALALSTAIASACSGRGGGRLTLPLTHADRFDVAVDSLRQSDRIFAVVRIRDRASHDLRRLTFARSTLGFTPTECALAEALLSGRTAAAYAEHKGVRIPTVRTQLQSMFAKAGVSRQADLLRLLDGDGERPAPPRPDPATGKTS